jgi:glycosyltransferase involved in cell wall biosynthesis
VDLICSIAERHPEYSILLVGPVANGFGKLKQHQNITMVGTKNYSVLPQYMTCMDVCLIPFNINRVTLAANPIKMYEYLAAGKPVVSTALPEVCNNAAHVVKIAQDESDFIKKVEQTLSEAENDEERLRIRERISFAKNNSWQKRVEEIAALL